MLAKSSSESKVAVATISGSYSGVVGLPVYELAELLGNAGIEVVKNQTNATA